MFGISFKWKKKMFKTLLYRGLSSSAIGKEICIIGSGPAGFYFAQHVLKALPDVHIDMYEKLPIPFGLVRYGVAPDHPEVKNVINTFTKTASDSRFRFIGNVTMGTDIPFSQLCKSYHAVVLAYGCNDDSSLGISGEKLDNVISARCFVGWYNGLPENIALPVDLSTENAIVLGQGNVALDVARILLTPIDLLKKTDITSYALEALSTSKVKNVFVVGRRGPLQAAFTIKEFREMTKLPGVKTIFRTEQLQGLEEYLTALPRPRKRLTELFLKIHKTKQEGDKTFQPVFFRIPAEILGIETVTGVKFSINEAVKHDEGKVISSDNIVSIPCGVVLRSIGYKGTCPDCELPFDQNTGKIIDCPGIYSTGWINTGPVGVILSTMNNAFKQAAVLVHDISTNKIDTNVSRPGYKHISQILKQKGIIVVNFEGWKKIDQIEIERGKSLGKSREKIVSIKEMLEIAGQAVA